MKVKTGILKKMSNYVELTEIFSKSSYYDPEIENVKTDYGLRQVYVNLDHLVYMEENTYLKEQVSRHNIIPGLTPALASFTNLYLMSPSSSYKKLDIIGKPSIVLQKIAEVKSAR